MTSAAPAPLFDALERFGRSRGVDVLELYEELGRHLDRLVPDGHRVAECGNCHRRSIVPSGAMLRDLRVRYELSQTEIARRAGYGRQHVCQVEAERREPTPKLLAAYEQAAAEASREAQG